MPTATRFPQIDLIVQGLNRGSGRSADRFRVSAETHDPALIAIYKGMVKELARRIGGLELLRACVDGHFGIAELHRAYAQGPQALADLLARKEHPPLAALAREYLAQYRRRTKEREQQRLDRFCAWLGPDADVTRFTRPAAEAFLAQLTDTRRRHGDPAPVSAGTRNRYHTTLHGFGTWLVEREIVPRHPLAGLPLYDEGPRRVRYLTPEEYRAYFAAIEAFKPELVPVFKVLVHTGADVGEVVVSQLSDGPSTPIRVRDLHFERQLPRILFKRSKVEGSPERLVPVPADVANLLTAHIQRHGLRLQDPVFGMFKDSDLRYAHAKAAEAIGRPDLTRKDLRHVAAVLWRKAGVDLERIREWLGHADIAQTVIYAGFGPDDQFDAPAIERVVAYLTPQSTEQAQVTWRKIA